MKKMYGNELATRIVLCKALFYFKIASFDTLGALEFVEGDRPKTGTKPSQKPKSPDKKSKNASQEATNGMLVLVCFTACSCQGINGIGSIHVQFLGR